MTSDFTRLERVLFMSLSKRQKILSAVFLLGLVGLVADRTILRPQGGPQAASADSAAPAPDTAVRSDNAPVAETPGARLPVAERLDRWLSGKESGFEQLRDPFSLPASWSETGAADREKTPDAVAAFLRMHQLQAVVMQGEDAGALIDDRLLMPGQSLDGFQLLSVGYRSAVFGRDGKQVVLELVAK
jgi:hypothetical protein